MSGKQGKKEEEGPVTDATIVRAPISMAADAPGGDDGEDGDGAKAEGDGEGGGGE